MSQALSCRVPNNALSLEGGESVSIYEYKVLHGTPTGHRLMPWASQELREELGPGALERQLNRLGEEGWEVVSSSTAPAGSFLIFSVQATVILRREQS